MNARALSKHKKRFLRFFPEGFADQRYIDWERTYKWEAHKLWEKILGKKEFYSLLRMGEFSDICSRAMQAESKTNFLFSFEKMALRDALRTGSGAHIFSAALYNLLYGSEPMKNRFVQWIVAVMELPRIKARVASWPVITYFPFIAKPDKYMILKPTAMVVAAEELKYDFDYSSKPSYRTYESLMNFANLTWEAIADLEPKDYHDIQSFLWVIGSQEYEQLSEEI